MASAHETNAAIGQVRNSVAQALQRCSALPGLDTMRLDRISEYRNRNDALGQHAAAIFDEIGKEERGPIDAANQVLTKLQEEVQQLNSEVAGADIEQRRRQAEFNKEKAAAAGNQTALQRLQQGHNQATAAHNAQMQALRDRIAEIQQIEVPAQQRDRDAAQRVFNEQLVAMRKDPNADLEGVLQKCRELLDDVAEYERQVQSTAGQFVAATVEADFTSKKEAFTEAATYHQKQAWLMLMLLGGLAAVTSVAIYCLFLSSSTVPVITKGSSMPTVLESVLVVGVGRIATLALLGLAFRYVALLHRANSEQLVIYRDRMAALGVAESIVQIFPLEKKFDLLKVLADGYLTFEHNAFRQRARGHAKARRETNDEAIKQLKDTVDAMKPAFEVVKSIADRVK